MYLHMIILIVFFWAQKVKIQFLFKKDNLKNVDVLVLFFEHIDIHQK